MNNNGFSGVKLIGYEHNWNDAGGYPVQLVSARSEHLPQGTNDDLSVSTVDATGRRLVCWCFLPLL